MKENLSLNEASALAIESFDRAWEAVIEDYKNRRINSERCLQAAVYSALRKRLDRCSAFRVFFDCEVRLGENRRYPDILICFNNRVVLVSELKYKPRNAPRDSEIIEDLNKLSKYQTPANQAGAGLTIMIERFRSGPNEDSISMRIAGKRRLVFAYFAEEGKAAPDASAFWERFGTGLDAPWEQHQTIPPYLCIRTAVASADGTAKSIAFQGNRALA